MRNRYKKSYICIAFALVSALSALAQSGRTDVQRWDGLQPKANDPGEPLLAALVEAPALGREQRFRSARRSQHYQG